MHLFALPIFLVAVAVTGVIPVDAQIINTLRGFDDEERGWSGELAGGVAVADGNTEYFEFELDGKIQYQTERNRWRAIGINMRRTALGEEVAKARLGHFRHNYRLWSRWSTIAFVQGQYNPFLRVQSRLLVGGGARLEIFRGKLWRSAVGAAYMYEREKLTGSADDTDILPSTAPTNRDRFSFFMTLYRVEKEGFDIDIWGFYQPLVEDLSDARATGAAGIRVDVVGELDLFVSYLFNYDSSPPVGVEKRDYMIRSGLGWEF